MAIMFKLEIESLRTHALHEALIKGIGGSLTQRSSHINYNCSIMSFDVDLSLSLSFRGEPSLYLEKI